MNCKVVNNTVYKNDTLGGGSGQIFVQYDTKNNIIKNNILVASLTNVLIYNEYLKNAGNVVDYNLYFTSDGSADAYWTWKNKNYTSFSAYKTGSGNDAHSLFNDPKFVNVDRADFHLQPLSPAIQAGSMGSAINGTQDMDGQIRVQGNSVNIGAYE